MAKRLRYRKHRGVYMRGDKGDLVGLNCKSCEETPRKMKDYRDPNHVSFAGLFPNGASAFLWQGPFCSATCFKKWRDAPAKVY